MNNVIQLEIAREIRELNKFAKECKNLTKAALYDHLWTGKVKPEEVVEEMIKSIVGFPIFFTELYITLPLKLSARACAHARTTEKMIRDFLNMLGMCCNCHRLSTKKLCAHLYYRKP